MSMSNNGGFAEVISEENLAKVVGQSMINAFKKAMEEADTDASELYNNDVFNGFYTEFEAEGNAEKQVIKAYQAICDKFHEETGMELNGGYLGAESSSYDLETEEMYWEVDHSDMWQKSPSLRAFEEKYGETIQRNFFSTFC